MRRNLLLCLALLTGLSLHLPAIAQQVGAPAPDFTLDTFDGRKITLSELKGKDVCIMMWASWCPYCKASMPDLNDYYQSAKKAGKPFEIIAVAIRDTPEKARKVYTERGMPYPTGIEDGNFEKLYPASRKTPTWVVVDKNGIVRDISSGRAYRNDFEIMFNKAR